MTNYICSALVNDRPCEDNVQAVSEKQAWYKFAKKYGFRMRNFAVVGQAPITVKNNIKLEQIRFDI